jgi:hypothetical protein
LAGISQWDGIDEESNKISVENEVTESNSVFKRWAQAVVDEVRQTISQTGDRG